MFINNREPRILSLNSTGAQVRLMPGINEVDPSLWAKVKHHPLAKHLIGDGVLKCPGEELTKMNPREAIQVVRDTLDAELLEQWSAEETRKQVLAAITEQQALLTKPAEPKK